MEHEAITSEILNAAIKVHRKLGPGLLESAYEACLRRELLLRGIKVEAQVPLPITYEGETIEVGYRLDLVVNDLVIIELKAVEKTHPAPRSPNHLLPPSQRKTHRAAHQFPRASAQGRRETLRQPSGENSVNSGTKNSV